MSKVQAAGGERHDSLLHCVLEAGRPTDCANRGSQSSEAPGCMLEAPIPLASFLGRGRVSSAYVASLPSHEIPSTLN